MATDAVPQAGADRAATEFVPAAPPFVNVGGEGNLIDVQADQALRTRVVNENPLGIAVSVTVDQKPPSKLGPLAVFGGFLRPFGGSVTRTVSVLSTGPQTYQVRIDVSGDLNARVFFYTNPVPGQAPGSSE